MKVHPAPKKRNITFRYDIASSLSQADALLCRQKKLRRLPHIFAKVLELPFHSDADVFVEETSDSLRFIVPTDDIIADDIVAHTIEIYPGVTKIVIKGNSVFDLSMDELDLDVWRFRLPGFTLPELASAIYSNGELVVTVPKLVNLDEDDGGDEDEDDEGIWGENGDIGGEIASKPIAPQDAATMQSAENIVLGETKKGGPAAVMQLAAAINERLGVVGHNEATNVTKDQGVTISEAEVAGHIIITEAVGGEVVGQYARPGPVQVMSPASALDKNAITIGEALEATALAAGDKPVDESDAAAIQAAEIRATGDNKIAPGGVAASAQSAATQNARTILDEYKTRLSDVLADATTKLTGDKAVTREDAERVIAAEIRNRAELATHPGGVSASMAAAARLNQEK